MNYWGKPWNKKEKWAPFGDDGRLLSYASGVKEWREVSTPFSADLKFDRDSRGRSSIVMIWKDIKTGVEYPMFISDFSDSFASGCLYTTMIAEWQVVKKGSNYGIKLVL